MAINSSLNHYPLIISHNSGKTVFSVKQSTFLWPLPIAIFTNYQTTIKDQYPIIIHDPIHMSYISYNIPHIRIISIISIPIISRFIQYIRINKPWMNHSLCPMAPCPHAEFRFERPREVGVHLLVSGVESFSGAAWMVSTEVMARSGARQSHRGDSSRGFQGSPPVSSNIAGWKIPYRWIQMEVSRGFHL